ncbi:hypothetical protein [Fodinicola feengrottensis]|nr:hypothetical protein [Fodinicola feengrottensis]
MVALQIRDVPIEVRDALAEQAQARGQSLQAFLLALVEREARRMRNMEILLQIDKQSGGSRLTAQEHAEIRTAERSERDRRFEAAPGSESDQ